MSFAAPWMLALAGLPLLAALVGLWPRTRTAGVILPATLRAFVGGNRVRITGRLDKAAQRPWRLWLAGVLLAVALARPQWGSPDGGVPAPAQLVIALDLSNSMLAKDVLPSRLERARGLAERLVDGRPSDRIGLIGFAGDAYLLAPPSQDRAVLRAFLPTISPEYMLRAGSDLARMAVVGASAFDRKLPGGRVLIILSDGETEQTGWRDRIGALRRVGVRVVAYGIGSAGGAPLTAAGKPLISAAGRPVVSRLQPAALKAFADATGGTYVDAVRGGELVAAVAAAAAKAPPGAAQASGAPEHFRLFVALALLLIGWSLAVEWPALRRLRSAARRTGWAAAAVGALVAGVPAMKAVSAPRIDPELHGMEPDPLLVMKKNVRLMLMKPSVNADDYQELADTAVRYGEVHRGHAHPLELGVLRDGLAAIALGEKLDPRRDAWAFDRARLHRLLQPPKPPADQGTHPGDPADDPADVEGKKQVEQSQQQKKEAERQADRDKREVGGTNRNTYDAAEWRNPSLVRPLALMQRIRAADTAAELFRLRQVQQALPPRRSGQTW